MSLAEAFRAAHRGPGHRLGNIHDLVLKDLYVLQLLPVRRAPVRVHVRNVAWRHVPLQLLTQSRPWNLAPEAAV